MALSDRDFLDYLEEALATTGVGQLYVPFETPADESEVMFHGFGIETAGDTFHTGWALRVEPDSQARYLRAFCTGALTYERGTPNRLILRSGDVLGALIRQDALPFWFWVPRYVIYETVDERDTQSLVTEYLDSNSGVVDAINAHLDGPPETVADLVTRFLANDLPVGVPIEAGERIGVAGFAGGERVFSLAMQYELDNPDGLYLDPAVYHHHWARFFVPRDLAGHPLEAQLKRIFSGPISNGVVRYVRQDGGATGDFTSYSSPARLPSLAIEAADSFDTIVIIDNATYREPDEIEINSSISITSLSAHDVMGTEAGSGALPAISGSRNHRVLSISSEEEIWVSIASVKITDGLFQCNQLNHLQNQPAQGGGGIAIQRMARVYVRNCSVYNNRTENILGLGVAEEAFGGGILVFHSEAYIYHNRISHNQSQNRGGGIAIFGYGWPVIEDNVIEGNTAYGSDPEFDRPDGGGVAAEIAVARIPELGTYGDDEVSDLFVSEELEQAHRRRMGFYRNQVRENGAVDDGGGFYLTVRSRAEFGANTISHNQAGSNGGGIRLSFGSWAYLRDDQIHDNESNAGRDVRTNSGGGGISSRNSDVILRNVRIEHNVAYGFAGGGIYFITSDPGGCPAFNFDPVLRNVYGITLSALQLLGRCSINRNSSTRLGGQPEDHRKGGGIYVLRWRGAAGYVALPMKAQVDNITEIEFLATNELEPSEASLVDFADIYIDDMVHRSGTPISLANLDESPSWWPSEDRFLYISD